MPHIFIEYNSAVKQALSIENLVGKLHAAAVGMDALPTGGIRTRAYEAAIAKVGDGDAANGFIYITVRLGQGRSAELRGDIGNALFAALQTHCAVHMAAGNPLSLGLEIQEIEKEWTWKHNNIHHILESKKNG